MGDPTGIGPEVIAGAWSNPDLHAAARMIVAGHPQIIQRACELRGVETRVIEVDAPNSESLAPLASSPDVLPCVTTVGPAAVDLPPAKIDARGGQAAYDAVVAAANWALTGTVDGLVTAPLHKAALRLAGYAVPGHTELLAELCDVREVAMMLYLPPGCGVHGPHGLGVVHTTLHMALRDVFAHLSAGAIQAKIRLAEHALKSLGALRPRIGVLALNPHAGEEGLFGDEEQRYIAPAVEQSRRAGIDARGPLPADTMLVRARQGEFDAVVAMYHDQGHIALKLLDMHRAVNITLGLPIIRTSVAHGTAFDRAWRGTAEVSGVIEAVRVAAQLARQRTGPQRSSESTSPLVSESA